MRTRRNGMILIALVATLALAGIGPTHAASPAPAAVDPLAPLEDVPLYRGNGTANGIFRGPGPTGHPELAWRVDVGGMHMVPILVDDQLIVGTNDGHLVALDTRTGATRWSAALGTDAIHPALASMDDLVYATDNVAAYAVDLDTGSLRWSVPTNSTASRVNATDGVIYTGGVGGVVGFDAQTGAVVWRWEGPPEVGISAGPIAVGTCPGCRQIVLLDPADRHVLERWDEPEVDGDGFGPLNLDPAGNIYLVTFGGASQLVFDTEGRLLVAWRLGPDMQGPALQRTIDYHDETWPSPVFLPDGRGFTFGRDGVLELKVSLPSR